MEKKRSVGVVVYAWFYILLGLGVGLLSVYLFTSSTSLVEGNAFLLTIAIISFILMASSIGILLSKEWCRKTHLIYVWLFTSLLIATIYLMNRMRVVVPGSTLVPESVFKVVDLIGLVPLTICIASTLFFTRPKVKEQFK